MSKYTGMPGPCQGMVFDIKRFAIHDGPGIRTYFKLDGHHIQFNVIDSDTLRKAQQEPELHRNLIVRVAGYSDYFIDLGLDLQNEIIFRTEQKI